MTENGFVLLTNDTFDYNQLVNDLQSNWQIAVTDVNDMQSTFMFHVGKTLFSLTIMPAPIPGKEAEHYAQGNYYCPDAVEIAEAHQAHLMVTMMHEGGSEVDGMKLYSKIIATCLTQENATGIYASGTVFSADFYCEMCERGLHGNGTVPVMIWVYIGLGQNEKGNQLYTNGMEKFDKEEMEINNSNEDMQTLHNALLSTCEYIISSGLVLKDGETIGFSANQKWSIARSESLYAQSEFSLKITL